MNQSIYEDVLKAVAISLSPHSPPDHRHQAYEWLEGFKTQDEAVQCAMHILTHPSADHTEGVQFFALHALEFFIKDKLSQLDVDAQVQVRDTIVLVVQTAVANGCPQLIKVKVAKLVADVAQILFPEGWPDFVPLMIGYLTEPATENADDFAELGLLIINNLLEDCVDRDFNTRIPLSRRQEILEGIDQTASELLTCVLEFMSRKYDCYCKMIDQPEGDKAAQLVNEGLELLEAVTTWLRADQVCDGTPIPQTILPLLSQTDFREQAAFCLQSLCSSKMTSHTFMGLVSALPEAVGSTFFSEDCLSDNSFVEIAEALSCLFTTNWQDRHNDPIFKRNASSLGVIQRYCELMLGLLQSPRKVSAELVPFWICIARVEGSSNIPGLDEMLGQALMQSMDMCLRIRWDEDTSPDRQSEEFEDKEEYLMWLDRARTSVEMLARAVARTYPTIAVVGFSMKVHTLVTEFSVSQDFLDVRGCGTAYSTADMKWEVLAYFAGHLVSNVPEGCFSVGSHRHATPEEKRHASPEGSKKQFPAEMRRCCVQSMEESVALLLAFRSDDPRMQYRCSGVLQCVGRFLKHQLQLVGPCLEKLFETVGLEPRPFPIGTAPDARANGCGRIGVVLDFEGAQGRAAAAISQIVADCSVVLSRQDTPTSVQIFQSIVNEAGTRLLNDQVSSSPRVSLYETVMSLVDKIPDQEKRNVMVVDIAHVPMSELVLEGQEGGGLTSVGHLLGQLCALPNMDPSVQGVFERAHEAFTRLTRPLNILQGIARRCNLSSIKEEWALSGDYDFELLASRIPFAHVWATILPTLASMFRVLVSIWSPQVRAEISTYEHLQALYFPIKNALTLPTQEHGKDLAIFTPGHLQPLQLRWGEWLHELLMRVCTLLGLSCLQKAMYVSESMPEVLRVLVQSLPYLDAPHLWVVMRHVVEPFCTNMPPGMHAHPSCPLLPLLASFLQHMLLRLSWTPMTDTHLNCDFETAWAPPIQDKLRPEQEALLYLECGVCTAWAGGDQEMLDLYREAFQLETRRRLSIFLAGLLGAQTPSARSYFRKKTKQPDSDAEVRAQRQLTLQLLQRSVAGEADLLLLILRVLVGLVKGPEAQAAVTAVQALAVIHDATCGKIMYAEAMGREVFTVLLGVLLDSPEWLEDQQLPYLHMAASIYLSYVHAAKPDNGFGASMKPKSKGKGSSKGSGGLGLGSVSAVRSALPKQVMCTLPGITPAILQQMDTCIGTLSSFKDKRELVKDVIAASTNASALGIRLEVTHLFRDRTHGTRRTASHQPDSNGHDNGHRNPNPNRDRGKGKRKGKGKKGKGRSFNPNSNRNRMAEAMAMAEDDYDADVGVADLFGVDDDEDEL